MKNRKRLSILGLVLVLFTLASAPAAQAGSASAANNTNETAAAKTGHVIVFQVSSGGAIYAVNPDGSGLRYLTTGMDPALSPDGKRVAFTRWQGQSNGASGSLWVINIDGTGERQVVGGANQAKSPTWSADGKQIIISMQKDGTLTDTYLCMVDGKPVVMDAPVEGERCMRQAANPHWGLRRVDVATGAYEDLAREAHSFAPTWNTANGWQVVFRGDKGLQSLDLNQGTLTVLSAKGSYRGPVLSPDGSKIAVTFNQNAHWEVHVLNVDGSGEVRLTETPLNVIISQQLANKDVVHWNNAAPAWSPDGKQIAFTSDRNGQYEIWVMNADGSNQHVLVSAARLKGLKIHYDGNDERVISWR